MIVLDVEQGSQAWHEARLGIPTASQFSRIVTPGGKLSEARETYLGELLAEWALGEELTDFQSEWMERGQDLEADAFRYYAFHADAEPVKVGFVYRDEGRSVGASPDGLVGEHGAIELKCPGPGKHLVWLSRDVCPKEHFAQVQGHIWVCGLDWCDFVSYHPGLPPFIVMCEPASVYQAALDEHMPTFIAEIEAGRERLLELGVQPPEPEPEPVLSGHPMADAIAKSWGKK